MNQSENFELNKLEKSPKNQHRSPLNLQAQNSEFSKKKESKNKMGRKKKEKRRKPLNSNDLGEIDRVDEEKQRDG